MALYDTPYERITMFRKNSASEIDVAITRVFDEMTKHEIDSEEYDALTDQLVRLYPLRNNEPSKKVSPDTKALIAANLLGIVTVVGYERTHVIATKAIGFVMKMR